VTGGQPKHKSTRRYIRPERTAASRILRHAHVRLGLTRVDDGRADISSSTPNVVDGELPVDSHPSAGANIARRPVILIRARILWRTLMERINGVICSTIRGISSRPQSTARSPGISDTNSPQAWPCRASGRHRQARRRRARGAETTQTPSWTISYVVVELVERRRRRHPHGPSPVPAGDRCSGRIAALPAADLGCAGRRSASPSAPTPDPSPARHRRVRQVA